MNLIMLGKFRIVTLLFCILMLQAAGWACLWDYDTLAMERSRFPDVLELMHGQFPRHSDEYYRWRIADRAARMADGEDTLALYDDIAVAHEKLGDHDTAINWMQSALERDPDRYETHANLGTFLIHKGDFEAGLQHIRRAIEINPDAHFGREIYQRYLVEYVIACRGEKGLQFPLNQPPDNPRPLVNVGFAKFLSERINAGTEQRALDEVRVNRALQGIMGMMRFGNYDSPVLLEALGDLLSGLPFSENANRLAARAYYLAMLQAPDESSAAKYREIIQHAIALQRLGANTQREWTMEHLAAEVELEQADAAEYIAQLRSRERGWIADGLDVDTLFGQVYYQIEPLEDHSTPLPITSRMIPYIPHLFVVIVILLIPFGIKGSRAKRARKAREAEDNH